MYIFEINASGQHELTVFARNYNEAVRIYMIYWVTNHHAELPHIDVAAGDGQHVQLKWIGGGLGEYRIDWGPGYRLYLTQDGDTLIVLFVGGTKKRQQADIDRASMLLAEYKARKAAASLRAGDDGMTLTRDFKDTVKERSICDSAFAKALLDEAATLFLNGEPHTARLILRDLVNASVGFETLAAETNRPSKSLHRMLSEKGNPSMDNLAAIFGAVRKRLGVDIQAHAVEAA